MVHPSAFAACAQISAPSQPSWKEDDPLQCAEVLLKWNSNKSPFPLTGHCAWTEKQALLMKSKIGYVCGVCDLIKESKKVTNERVKPRDGSGDR